MFICVVVWTHLGHIHVLLMTFNIFIMTPSIFITQIVSTIFIMTPVSLYVICVSISLDHVACLSVGLSVCLIVRRFVRMYVISSVSRGSARARGC